MNWIPCTWRLEGQTDRLREVKIEAVANIVGPDRFAIRRTGSVLNREGEWEYEPNPSSRDDDFFARCRYPTMADAIATFQKFHK